MVSFDADGHPDVAIDARTHRCDFSLSVDGPAPDRPDCVRFSGWVEDLQIDDCVIFPLTDNGAAVFRVLAVKQLGRTSVVGVAAFVTRVSE